MRTPLLFVALLLWSGNAGGEPKSGLKYQSAETRAMQSDDFANPGMLWVERGAALWQAPADPRGKSCASCHGPEARSMAGVAARYPAHIAQVDRVLDLEARINLCRETQMSAPAFEAESDALLALTVYIAHQSRGQPMSVATDGAAMQSLARGKAMFEMRIGQLNLACRHCHIDNAGRMLRGDRISEGMPNGYPAYRLDWQKLGSLQRRLRACFAGVRAEPPTYGAQELIDLSLYLAARSAGLPVETPAVRR